jgi:acetolactate decarboxylase
MKLIAFFLTAAFWLCSPAASLAQDLSKTLPPRDTLFQVSTIDNLLKGGFDGEVPLAELLKHGDTGIGTLDGLDGELLITEGAAYQIGIDGVARRQPDTAKTPFAAVSFFESDIALPMKDVANFDDLSKRIKAALPSGDAFYLVRIRQTFDTVKARSVPRQQKPYPTLAEAAKAQAIFEFQNQPGVMVGLWCPSTIGGLNAAGLHLHFLTADKTRGGHVLDFSSRELTVELDRTDALALKLPLIPPPTDNERRVGKHDLDKVER